MKKKKQEGTMKSFVNSEKEEERGLNSTKWNIMFHNLGENTKKRKKEQRRDDMGYVEELIRNRMGLTKTITVKRFDVRINNTTFKTK